jgi:hypothetical protein
MEEEIKKAKKEAYRVYKRLSKEKVYCPALKCNIRISEAGLKHLSEKARYPKDKLYRLKIFPLTPIVIQKGKHIETRKENEVFRHSIEARIKDRIIRVIVQEDNQGNMSFYSIMDRT